MDFNKTRYRLNNIVHVEDMDNGELELIMSQLESSVFEDPFNSGDLVNLARAKIAFGQVFAFTNEQALEYFIDAVTLTDKALTYLPDDEISITESKDSFFFIKNRTQRLKNNNIRFQAYSSALQANILCYLETEDFPSGQKRHRDWALDAANGLNKILPTAPIARDLKEIYEISNEFFTELSEEHSDPKYRLARMDARYGKDNSIKLAREIDPRFPKIIPQFIN
ncbi:MAG: hypothetical protein CXT77_04560 [uncultured DHVE6 group euryarchaeote]|jgi:hypothetical protein|nr:MAG: hypothetical protein CXT77_04560 [uncultured DHVE6 group euryarchaeote]